MSNISLPVMAKSSTELVKGVLSQVYKQHLVLNQLQCSYNEAIFPCQDQNPANYEKNVFSEEFVKKDLTVFALLQYLLEAHKTEDVGVFIRL